MSLIHDVTQPGLMISQTWPVSRESEGATLKAIEIALEEEFFISFQCVEIPYPEERKRIASLLGSHAYPLTYCIARVLNENSLNLSDLDSNNRNRSCDMLIRCLDDAREAGAVALSFISGARPVEPGKRADALKRLEESLVFVSGAASKSPSIDLIIEPLDFNAHKKNTLGSADEALDLCRGVESKGGHLQICLDTAHMILNGDDPVACVEKAHEYASEFHFCNCVTEASHPLYGDRHIPFGEPGIVDTKAMAGIMKRSVELGYYSRETRPRILCEVLKRKEDESVQVLRSCRKILEDAWALKEME